MHQLLRTAAAAALVAATHGASAQNTSSTKAIGGWVITCTTDGMTDKTTCGMGSTGPEGGLPLPGGANAFLGWFETDKGPTIRLLLPTPTSTDRVLARVDKTEPFSIDFCRDRACMPKLDMEAAIIERIASGQRMLVRAEGAILKRDFLFDISGLADARREFAARTKEAGQAIAHRPMDLLERAQIARAEIEERDRKNAAAKAAIDAAADSVRRRCEAAFEAKDRRRTNCEATARMCANNPIPRNVNEFQSCFDSVFPRERFTKALTTQ